MFKTAETRYLPGKFDHRLNVARVDGIDVILLCPSVETYQQHFWNYRQTGTYPAVFDHFKKFRYERTYQWNSQHQPFRD